MTTAISTTTVCAWPRPKRKCPPPGGRRMLVIGSGGFGGIQVGQQVLREPVTHLVDDAPHGCLDGPARGAGERQVEGDLERGDQTGALVDLAEGVPALDARPLAVAVG